VLASDTDLDPATHYATWKHPTTSACKTPHNYPLPTSADFLVWWF
jgi:hypothetical protein